MLQNHNCLYGSLFVCNHFSFSSICYDALITVEATKLYLNDFDFHFCGHCQNVMWALWKEEFQHVTYYFLLGLANRDLYEKLKPFFLIMVKSEKLCLWIKGSDGSVSIYELKRKWRRSTVTG